MTYGVDDYRVEEGEAVIYSGRRAPLFRNRGARPAEILSFTSPPYRPGRRAPRVSVAPVRRPGRGGRPPTDRRQGAAAVAEAPVAPPASLDATGLAVHFEGVKAVDGVDLELTPRRDPRPDRPERRRQDHLRQRPHRLPAADRGRGRLDGGDVTGWGAAPARPHRPRPHVPERPPLPRPDRCSRTSRSARVGDGLVAREARERARASCSTRFEPRRLADRPRAGLPHGRGAPRSASSRALATRPRFLLLDEPAAGLNEHESDELVERARGNSATTSAAALLVIEHDMRVIMRLCERIQVLDYGKTIAIGTPDEVRARPGGADGLSRRRAWRARCLRVDDLQVELRPRRRALKASRSWSSEGEIVGARRPERRRQVDDARDDLRPDPPASGLDLARGRAARRASRRSGSSASGSLSCPRDATSSTRSPSARTSSWARPRGRDRAAVRTDIARCSSGSRSLERYYESPAGRLSGGEQQQLAIARALLCAAAAAPARRAVARTCAGRDRPRLRRPRRAARARA